MRDFIPAIVTEDSLTRDATVQPEKKYFNTIPVMNEGGWAIMARPTFDKWSEESTLPAAGMEARGICETGIYYAVVTDQDIVFFDKSDGTEGPLAATAIDGNASFIFDDELNACFAVSLVSGTPRTILQNAGDSTLTARGGTLWNLNTGGVAELTNAPGSRTAEVMVRGVAELDGFLFLCKWNGTIYNSNLNDPTAWTATDFITAERWKDVSCYLGRHHDNVVCFGTKGIEFFYNAGNATGSPLARRQDIFHSIGCYHPNSHTPAGDTIYFVGKKVGDSPKVYALTNFMPAVISTPYIDAKILDAAPYSDFDHPDVGGVYALNNYNIETAIFHTKNHGPVLLLHLDETYAYHIQSGTWHQWAAGATPTNAGRYADWTTHFPIVGSTESGKILFTNGNICDEAGTGGDLDDLGLTAAEAYFYTPPWSKGAGDKVRINRIDILGTAQANSTNDPSNIAVSWVDSKPTTASGITEADFTGDRNVNIADGRARMYRCGTTYQRIFKFKFDPDAAKNQSLDVIKIDYDVMV